MRRLTIVLISLLFPLSASAEDAAGGDAAGGAAEGADDFDYDDPLLSVSSESRQKLAAVRPQTLGQASRISGVSPADVSTLMVVIHARERENTQTGKGE